MDYIFDQYRLRLYFRLDRHNCSQSKATLCDPQSSTSLQLDTRLIEPFDARIGSLFQVIGELECGDTNQVVLKARVIRCVDGMDLIMYRRVVDSQRRYLKSREES